jgi:hypothetical protein
MKFKLYVATPVITQQETGKRFYFTSSPASGGTDTIEFEYYNNYPDTGSTATITVPLLAVPAPYTNEQMASDFRSFASLFSSLTAIYQDGTTYASIFMNNGSPIINVVYSNSFGYADGIIEDVTENQWELLTMFKDETLEITSKLNDIEKLSNVFMDVTNTFTVPAAENDHIFKHYYDSDIDDPINANIRLDAYLEIDSFPFRYGKVQLEGVTLKKQRPDNYKITFYGGLLQLTDLFGEDTIDRLDYDKVIVGQSKDYVKYRDNLSRLNFEMNETNWYGALNDPSFKDGDVMTPLISYTDRDWEYGTDDSDDIGDNEGKIRPDEVRPAIRIIKLIEAIEAKYGVSFTRNFFGTAQFNNLFMWMNESDTFATETWYRYSMNPITSAIGFPNDGSIILTNDNYIQINGQASNLAYVYLRIIPDNYDIKYSVRLKDINGNVLKEIIDVKGLQNLYYAVSPSASNSERITTCYAEVSTTFTNAIQINFELFRKDGNYGDILCKVNSVGTEYSFLANMELEKALPKLKVLDFLQGLMKQFKLVIRPLSGNQFYIDTLNNYYNDGNVLDITPYVDNETCTIERPLIYKTIKFKYQKTNNATGAEFRERFDPINDEIGYGDLFAEYPEVESGSELTVDLPFENMMFERLIVQSPNANANDPTNIYIGQSISVSDDGSVSKNKSKPILFYNNGLIDISSSPILCRFKDTDSNQSLDYVYLVGNTNDELIAQVTDTLNFNSDIDPWHGQIVANSLYLNYWEDWVNTIYDLKQRKFTFEGFLPPRYVEELSLNDRLIIGSNRYKINDYKINLLDGKTKLTLFKDIYEWNAYNFPTEFTLNERAFSPNGWFMTDTINNGESAYIYGSFSGSNSTNYGRIIKLLPNGDVASDFNTGTGFINNSFGFQSIYKQNDGKILATGNFTSFNGTAMNRLARLNTDGSLDNSLVIGSGFNNVTSGVDVDSQGRIIVAGTFTSYSGVSSRCIIRLTSGGTVDTAVGLNGFSNATNSVVVNSDDSLYVGGYFTGFSGTVSNRLIKLTSGFTVDSSFNVGAGLNSNTSNQPVGLVADVDDGVFVYGFFTTYSGQSANRLVRLTSTGQIHPNWYIGSGFNNSISSVYKVLNDKLLVYGPYTQFNGLSVPNGLLVLNPDGSIYRNFNGNYVNVFTIGNRFYGNLANGVTELIDDEELPILSSNSIIANAGAKYYSVNVLKNVNWSVSAVDAGYGTDWVEITTPSGTSSSEIVFRVNDKTNQTVPDLYQPRYVILRFDFDGIYRDVLITQNGLQA